MAAPALPLPGEPAAQRLRAAVGRRVTGATSLIAFLGLWQLVIVVWRPNPILFPGPLLVVEQLAEVWRIGLLWPAVADSAHAMGIGLALSLVVGVPIGLVVGMSRWVDLITSPYLWGFFAMPRIALAPLMILWFGFGTTTKIWLVFLSAVVPMILSCKDGVLTVDETLLRAARSFCAGPVDLFRKVIAPSTVPFIASGIRNGISRGFVGLLVVELTVGSGGVGTEVMRAMRGFNTARMFAFVAVLVLGALGLISLSRRLEEYASRWREEVAV